MKLGELLLEEGVITPHDLSHTLRQARQSGQRLGDLLVGQGFLSSSKLKQILGVESHLPFKVVNSGSVWPSWQKHFSIQDLSDGQWIPIGLEFSMHRGESVASMQIVCVGAPDSIRLREIEHLVRNRIQVPLQKVIFYCSHPAKSQKILASLQKSAPKRGAWFLDETGCISIER